MALPQRLAVLFTVLLSASPVRATDGDRPQPERSPDGAPAVEAVAPSRFGARAPDAAYGAFQRGLYVTAFDLALPRAEAGEVPAQILVAEIYSRGLGIARDEAQAAEWYRRAAEKGAAEAQFQYAMILIEGTVVEKDEAQAFALLEEAANAGNRLAQFNFAQMLLAGSSNGAAFERAVTYYDRAAEQGLADAQYAMAQFYANGVGGKPFDEAEARRYLELSARQNYDTAQLDLGTWLVEGRGGERDEAAGFGWLRAAATGGNVAAQNRLAKLYRHGLGVEADRVAAAAWYILARRAGLTDPEMDDHLLGLTDEESEEANLAADRLR